MSAKDARIVVRMSEELRAWVHEQAAKLEMDDAAWVRMALARFKNDGAILRDYGKLAELERIESANEPPPDAERSEPITPVDIDALVGDALATAEATGQADPRPEQAPQVEPEGAVRRIGAPRKRPAVEWRL
jgi:hypothetical protein